MQLVRLMIIGVLLPLGLAACQNTQVVSDSSNAYGGNVFDQPLNMPASIKDLSPAEAKPQAVAETVPVKSLEEQLSLSKEVAATPAISAADAQVAAIADEPLPIVALAADPTKKLTPQQRLALGRATYAPIIAKHAKANGVPLALAMAVVEVESNYRPKARGRAGEIGLMQLLPRTARYIGYEGKMKHLYHPDTNIQYGMKYLGKAYRLGGGTTCGTILKYNAGHAAKRMNRISRHYCRRVQRIMRQT